MSRTTVDLTGTYYWGGEKFGPGEGVKVPAEMAAWLNPSQAQAAPADPTGLPEDFPERDLLTGTAWTTREALAAVSDDDLLAVDGIGPAKLKAIRAALKG